ncbi:MAG: hypothetical protein KAG97_08080, partial [Victivallales bacterium]|nr:hypothetical protein [Victivallales bacterium]
MEVKTREFTFAVDDHGCIESIHPNLDRLNSRETTIGAIADDNATHTETIVDFFDPKVCGDVRLYDELLKSHITLSREQSTPNYTAVQTWRPMPENSVEWEMVIKHIDGDERELTVELILPHPIFPGSMGSGHSKWYLWGATGHAPFSPDYGFKRFHHCKCVDENTDVPLPLFTLYDPRPESNIGLSYLLPPDQVWYTDFCFDQREWLTTIRFNNLGLTRNGAITLKLVLFSHAGCFRPAMGYVRKRYPAFFAPMEGQEKVDGNMAYTIPMIPEKRIADWTRGMNYKWNELFICREFGNYVPEEPFDSDHFVTDEHPEWSVRGVTYDQLNEYVELCHNHGVNVMPYLNISECESEIARRDYPDSIVRTTSGDTMTTWKYYDGKQHNILMNCDPEYSWCDAVIDQFVELRKRLPGIDGFWFDQMGYGWIDTAHFDGFTFHDNRPAYNMANMYIRALKRLREQFPRPGIVGMGNAPVRWQLMEFLDGTMAEGSANFLNTMAPLSPERPTVLLAEGESAFQKALLFGANLHVSPYYRYPTSDPLPEDALRLFKAYNPLMEFQRGRRWVYSPNPLKVYWKAPNIYHGFIDQTSAVPNIDASIFINKNGEYVISIAAAPKGMLFNESFLSDVIVAVRIPDISKYEEAIVMGADYEGYYRIIPRIAENDAVEL